MSNYLPVVYDKTDSLWIKSLGYENNPDLAHWGPGYRDYCVLHYVVKGSGYYNHTKVYENQGFFIPENTLQEYHSDSDNPWNYYWIIFSAEAARKYVLPLLSINEAGIFSFSFKNKLSVLFQNIFSKHTYLSHTRALGFLFSLLSFHDVFNDPGALPSRTHVENAKLYIEHHFNKKISVTDVADHLHINDRYLYNLFMRHEGISPKEYIDRQRCLTACDLLTHTNMSVSDIAVSIGFPDVCTFSKFFTNREKLSPTKYRSFYNASSDKSDPCSLHTGDSCSNHSKTAPDVSHR